MAVKFTSLFHISIWMLAGQVSCGSIAGWWNTEAPNFILQDDETGGIQYSLCNSNHTPIFPDDRTLTVPFTTYQPKINTSLAAAGWTDAETAWASIFYLDNNDEIVNALLRCDMNTGHWASTGEFLTSGGSPKVAPDTGLSVVLLGSTDGYRVFYNDLDGTLHQIGYTSTTTWKYYGVVSNDKMSSQAIASASANSNITVVRPRDGKNIGVSRLYSDHSWHISTFPESLTLTGNSSTNTTSSSDLQLNTTSANFTLPAWDGQPAALTLSIDKQYTRSIFYIGTDQQVHQASNINYAWSVPDPPAANVWPEADAAGSSIGIVSDFNANVMRLYYRSGGRMVEAVGDRGNWQAATVLATVNQTQVDEAANSNSTADSPSLGDESRGGLSDGAKAGISVGVTLGVLAIGGMLFAFWFLRRRQRKIDAAAAVAAASTSAKGAGGGGSQFASPSTAYTAPVVGGGDGYPPQNTYTPLQAGYGQQQNGYGQPVAYGHAIGSDGGYGYPQQQQQQQAGGWAYPSPPADGQHQQQQYFYQQQPQHQQQYPQELADQPRAVELLGEGHYKEIP